MSFCSNCGQSNDENSKFCPNCGTLIQQHQNNDINVKKTTITEMTVQNAISLGKAAVSADFFDSNASSTPGETALFEFSPKSDVLPINSPISVIFKGIVNIFKGIKSVFRDKKSLILSIILALLWIVLIIFSMAKKDSQFTRILSVLTFSQGGMKTNILGIVTGLFGKGIFAVFFVSLFSGKLKGASSGFKKLFSSYKYIKTRRFSGFLIGTGFSLIFYNFIVASADLKQCMFGVAGFFLMLRALGERDTFIRRLFVSLTAKKTTTGRTENKELLEKLLSGLAFGFVLSVALSAIPFAYTPYCAGAAAIITAAILTIINSKKKGE